MTTPRTLIFAFMFFAMPLHAATRSCPAVAGSEGILKPGARVILGEMHGNQETQQLFGQLACLATKLGPLRIGLEIPADEQPRLDTYLASAGSAADRKALLMGKFWTREFQDGRSSVAMAGLLESLRGLRHDGADVKLLAFDLPATAIEDGSNRDREMARTLDGAFKKEPAATFLVLVGNLHARKTAHPRFPQMFMAHYLMHLFKQDVTTLDVRYSEGTTWACMPQCGAQVIGQGPALPVGITLAQSSDGAYDGTFAIGAPTFAPPAGVPLSDGQKLSIELVALKLEASHAVADKKLARAAELFVELGRRDPAKLGSHAYDAACVLAQAGDANQAFTQLGLAVEHGFSDRAWLEQDKDLTSLHGDARWPKLLARFPSPPTLPKK